MMKLIVLFILLLSCSRNEINTDEGNVFNKIKSSISYSIDSDESFSYSMNNCENPSFIDESKIGQTTIIEDSLSYIPSEIGEDSFSINCNNEILIFNVLVNEILPPIFIEEELFTNEDIPLSFVINFSSERDVNFSVLNNFSNGSLSGTFPNLVYTPDLNFNGEDNIRFELDNGSKAEYNLKITVTPVNDPPASSDITVTTSEDTPVSFSLVANDIDSSMSYSISSNVSNGTLNCTNENCNYSPYTNFNGSDSFVFEVSDGEFTSSSTVTINVTSVNDSPITNPLVFNMSEDTTLNFNLVATDETALAFSTTAPSSGSLTCVNENCSFTPDLNFNGSVSFNYTADDGFLNSSSTVQINVNPVNDLPTGSDNNYSLDMNTNLNIALLGSDVDGDSLTYVASSPTSGSLTCTNNNCIYTPNTDYYGLDSFDYYISDGTGNSSVYTIDLTINHVNRKPIGASESLSTDEDTNLNITLQGSDADSDPLTYIIETNPTNGTLSCTNQNCVYSPNLNYYGSDSFTYKVNDGSLDSDIETISLTINPINDNPIASNLSFNFDFNSNNTENLVGSDIESAVTFEIVSPPSEGTVSITGNQFQYNHTSSNLVDSFTYRSFDGSLYSSTMTVSLTINPDPQARDNSIKIAINPSYFENVNDFPFYYNLKNLPFHFWNNVQSNGGDITITNDSGDRLPLEIVNLNTFSQSGNIWFKGSSSNYFYINYNNSATANVSLTPSNDTYGSFNVWTEYVAVWHLDDFTSATDSLGNLNLTNEGTPTFQEKSNNILDNSILFNDDDGNDDSLYANHNNILNLDDLTLEAWVYSYNEEDDARILQKRNGINYADYGLFLDMGYPTFRYNDGLNFQSTNKVNTNEWNYLTMTYDGSELKSFINGGLDRQTTMNITLQESNDIFEIGGVKDRNARGIFANIDEVRISNKSHSAEWIRFNYEMLSKNDFWQVNDAVELISSNFSSPNSDDLPTGWSETESNNTQITIENNSIKIDASNEAYLPLASFNIGSYTSGTIEATFSFIGNRFGNEMYYEFNIQLINDAIADYHNTGVAAYLKWASIHMGMDTNIGFGYRSDNVTYELFPINNTKFMVKIIADIDNKKYKILTEYGDSSWIDFEDLSLTEINAFRFYAHELEGGNVEVFIDDLNIIHY